MTNIGAEFLESLCTPDYQQDRIEIKVASHTTCEWIRRHAMYKSFRSHPGSRILHVYGNAGSGKSVLAKHVWKGLSSELRSSPKGDMVLLYYCCNARTRPDESAASILRALIHQFLWQKSLAFKNVVQSNELMQSRSISGGSTDWTFSALWSIFKDIVANSQDQVYCIIDGLDECENESMEDLLLLLPSLLKKGNSKAFSKFFLTSRVEGHIVSALEGHAANITITSDVTRHDVEIYVGERLANLTRRLRLNAKEEQNLRRLLAERASGMFLWVDLAIKDLEKTYGIRAKTIARRVRSLPSGLNALYERMLSKIDAMCEDQDTFQLARKMLTWIALAARPLTLNELRIALAMEVDTKDLDSLEPLQNISYDLLGLCGSFVEIIRKSNNDFPVKESQVEADELEDLSATVRLIHQSAKEYLVDSSGIPDSLSKYRINSHMGNAEIARICLTYLLSQNFAVGPIRADSADLTKHTALLIRRLNRFGLLEYVSIHWPTHARDGEREDVNMQVCVFLRDNVNHYRSWHQAHVFVSLLQFIQTFDLTEIHAASTLGLDAVVILLLDQGSDVDAKAGYNQTPLHYAAWKGHMKVLKLLLDRGADIEAEIHGGGRALHLVALRGNMEAIRLLLDRGAKVESSAHSAWTLLHPVVEAGNLELLKLLLDKGANINEWDTRKSTLLHRAAWKGHLDIVRLLLDRGADIQAKNGSDWTALHVAVENGHLEIAQLLLDKGIEVDAKTSQGRTAVHYAARHGHSNLIRTLLLRRQADIAAKTLNGRTVLHIAAQKGHFETVKMILEQRTEVKSETIDEDNFAAFYDALEYSHGPVAEVLLGSVKLDEHGYDMALQAAAYYGLETLVLSLLESHNGSFNCQKVCAQALQIACINGKVAVVNDLISAGANPNQTDEHGWSPVSCALHFQQQAVLDKLLESGADVALAGKNAFLSPTSMNSADSSRRLVFDDDGMTIRYHGKNSDHFARNYFH